MTAFLSRMVLAYTENRPKQKASTLISMCSLIWVDTFCKCIKAFSKQQSLGAYKLKKLADNNFKLNENARKFSKQAENTVGKGEIAHYEQISPFPTVFSKDLYCRHVKIRACLGKG